MVYATSLEELSLSLSTPQESTSSGMRLSSDAARHGSWWSASSRTYRSALHLYGSHTIKKQDEVNRRHRLLLMRYFVYVEKHRGHEYALLPLQELIDHVSRIGCNTSGSDLVGLQSPCHLKYILDAQASTQLDIWSVQLPESISNMDQRMESLELAASRADQPRSRLHLSAQQRKTILISLGCGVLQLPIWGVLSTARSVETPVAARLTISQAWQ